MLPTQPLRFSPVFRSYLWGGSKLADRLGKKVPGPGEWAESWEIVDHGEDQSVVVDAHWAGWSLRKLIEAFPDEILGDQPSTKQFPLLLKYLDCNRVLSVQVHPDDAYGATLSPPDLGKTEAWYVVEADPEAVVYAGLRQEVTADSLRRAIQEGKTEETLHVIHPKAGDCIFIPAGTVHALGAGLVVAEIQQASDTTFRLYDWNRVDASGKGRPLHIEQAMDVIDFRRGPVAPCVPQRHPDGYERLVDCDKFTLDRFSQPGSFPIPCDRSFRIVTIVEGEASLSSDGQVERFHRGETVLIPAIHSSIEMVVSERSTALVAMPPRVQGS